MKRKQSQLSAKKIDNLKKPGMYPDGGGLNIRVTESGSKNWVFRYRLHGKEKRQGLGSHPTVSLAEARIAAMESKQLLHKREDPISTKKEAERQRRVEAIKGKTFSEWAEKYIATHQSAWSNEKHINQWRNTLATYAYPVIGNLAVQDLGIEDILQVLEPLWESKTETATRVRQRIEKILDWAQTMGFRGGENPARWQGCLIHVLPSPTKIKKVRHHPAMAYSDLPAFYAELRKMDTQVAKVLAFLILTAARSSEALGARWDEISLEESRWEIPAERMKARRPHAVPLASKTVAILKEAALYSHNQPLVFPGLKGDKPLSDTALRKLLQASHPGLTLHGFRSTFRQWCAEQTGYAREVAEMALAHTIGSATERAYQRSDLYDKRHLLMTDWASFCGEYRSDHK